jgi:hypothetical protein
VEIRVVDGVDGVDVAEDVDLADMQGDGMGDGRSLCLLAARHT